MARQVSRKARKNNGRRLSLLAKVTGQFSNKLNNAQVEDDIGFIVGDMDLEILFRAELNLLSAVVTRAENLKRENKPITLDTLLGKPGKPGKDNLVRGRLKQIIVKWVESGAHPTYGLVFLIPDGHPMCAVVQKVVLEGIPKIYSEEYMGDKKRVPAPPKWTFKWYGLHTGQEKSHSPALLEVARERWKAQQPAPAASA